MGAFLSQSVQDYLDISLSGKNDWRYCSITFSCSVQAFEAETASLRIIDGVGESSSSYHSGGGAFETLTVTHVIDEDATEITVFIDCLDPSETREVYFTDAELSMDKFDREVSGGCPCCGSYLYDEKPAPIPPLQ